MIKQTPVTIWKFPIRIDGEQTVMVPGNRRLLFVGVQDKELFLWAEVVPGHTKCPRILRIYGTGHPMPTNPGTYINTFMIHDGALVFHSYEGIVVA